MFDLKPSIRVLNSDLIQKIHHDALSILEKTGIKVDDSNARKMLEKASGNRSKNNCIQIPEKLVQESLDSAPSAIQIYDRMRNPCFELKGEGTQKSVFGIGVTNLNYQDPFQDRIMPFSRQHMADTAGLGHVLDGFDFISTPGVIQDLPPETADLYGIVEMMANTTKPIVMLISDWQSFNPALDLCWHLHDDFSSHPFVIPYVNPITPLVMNSETTMKMEASIKRGLPFIFSNYGMAGATCPITPAGTLALLTAELLAGLVFSQVVKKGTPVILGSLPHGFDMKKSGGFYSPQSMLLNLACAEMMEFYNIPHCGTSGSGNGWGADLLEGTTQCINHLTSSIGSAGMIPFVGGSFQSLVFSPELVVYADDVIHQSRKFASGFSLDDESVGFSDISSIGAGGNFLFSSLTGRHFRQSQFSSTIWPLLTLDKWKHAGEPKADKILKQRTCELLNNLESLEDKQDILSRGESFLSSFSRDGS